LGALGRDPDLITLKAVRRLADANLVLYGALVGKDVLKLAPQARRLFVGKRAGRLDKASYFRAYGFPRARSLTGGLAAWDAEVGREAIPAPVEEARG
jgi:hypothetical protein